MPPTRSEGFSVDFPRDYLVDCFRFYFRLTEDLLDLFSLLTSF